jgi:hypothetical protein
MKQKKLTSPTIEKKDSGKMDVVEKLELENQALDKILKGVKNSQSITANSKKNKL